MFVDRRVFVIGFVIKELCCFVCCRRLAIMITLLLLVDLPGGVLCDDIEFMII